MEELTLNRSDEKGKMKSKSKSTLREYAEAIVIAVLLAVFIRTFVVQAFKIPSGSMKETLLVGDHILVNKFTYGTKIPFTDKTIFQLNDPDRGDIIVFKYPVDPSKDFIKRVIGLPGDRIRIENKKVFINDEYIEEPYAQFTDNSVRHASIDPRDNIGTIKVPENSYFVMGDNRDESYDSRFWNFVDKKDIKGKAFIIYWSWNSNGSFAFSPSDSFVRFDRLGKTLH